MTTSMIAGAALLPMFALVFIVALMIMYFVAAFSFLFLLFTSPDRLQSEEYQIRKRSLEISQEKGEAYPTIIDPGRKPISLTPVSNDSEDPGDA